MGEDNRTERATPRRRAEARSRGQVGKSMEITSVAVLFAGLLTLNSRGAEAVAQFTSVARGAFLEVGNRELRPEALIALVAAMLASSSAALIPLVLAVMITGVSLSLAQVGPMFSMQVITPTLKKLDLLVGLKRMWSGRTAVELVKAAIKVSVLGFVAYQVIIERYWIVVGLQAASPEGMLAALGSLIVEIGQKCGLALLVMAAADYVYQRHTHEETLKMSKQEIKEEARQGEADPQVKGKIRQLQKQLASHRMMASVPRADVVITNPVHVAVALEYKPPRMQAPLVTAKGQLLVAEQIKRVAREHGVPVIENPPLARAIYRSVDIGMDIPPALYQAVAETLAFIYRLRESAAAPD